MAERRDISPCRVMPEDSNPTQAGLAPPANRFPVQVVCARFAERASPIAGSPSPVELVRSDLMLIGAAESDLRIHEAKEFT